MACSPKRAAGRFIVAIWFGLLVVLSGCAISTDQTAAMKPRNAGLSLLVHQPKVLANEVEAELVEAPAEDLPFERGDSLVLDLLWFKCEGGDGASCDELFEQSPLGSDYEAFGVSCGDRDDVLNCVDLDVELAALADDPVPETYVEWQRDRVGARRSTAPDILDALKPTSTALATSPPELTFGFDLGDGQEPIADAKLRPQDRRLLE